jgi:hypothetical protein
MPGATAESSDFFLSGRGSVAAIAQEAADVLAAANYKVFVQDYDIPLGASFVEAMHDGIKNARGLFIFNPRATLRAPGCYSSAPWRSKRRPWGRTIWKRRRG